MMAVTLISQGDWVRYVPDVDHPFAPPNALYCKRVSDDADWYETARSLDDGLYATALLVGPKFVLQAVTDDPSRLFPQGCRLFLIQGYTGDDAQADLGGKIYDPANGTVVAPPPLVQPSVVSKKVLWERCTDQEAETLVQLLGTRSIREQRMFSDANYLDRDDPFFSILHDAVTQALGSARADAILAPSV